MNIHNQSSNSTKDLKTKLDSDIFKLTLCLYSNPLLSKKAVDNVITLFSVFISENFVPFLKNRIDNKLKSVLDEQNYLKIQHILEENQNIFQNFSTEHLRFKLYEEKSLYVKL